MGKIICFAKKSDKQNRKFRKKIVEIITIVASICTITGVTVIGVFNERNNEHHESEAGVDEQNWQAIAEEYNNKALDFYNSGEYEQAIQLYDKAIELEIKGIEDIEVCYFNRGRTYFKLREYQKAIGDYTKAIEINPESKYYSERAIAYEKIGDIMNASLDNVKAITFMME